jgi:hypothetical protein
MAVGSRPRSCSTTRANVQVRTWRAFSIVNTPGVQRWAESKERIERLAHEAVERADLVFLAFDSFNQKNGEFKQVERWVTYAGKAAIALLNVEDESWRFDDLLSWAIRGPSPLRTSAGMWSTSRMLGDSGCLTCPSSPCTGSRCRRPVPEAQGAPGARGARGARGCDRLSRTRDTPLGTGPAARASCQIRHKLKLPTEPHRISTDSPAPRGSSW